MKRKREDRRGSKNQNDEGKLEQENGKESSTSKERKEKKTGR